MARQYRAPIAMDTASAQTSRALAGLNIDAVTTVSNAAYTILATDRIVAQIGTMSTARIWTLPAASALNPGQPLTILDASGTVSSSNSILIFRAGSDTINGATASALTTPYGARTFVSDGTSKWNEVANDDVTGFARGGTSLTAVGAANTALRSNGTALAYAALIGASMQLVPTGAIAQTVPRHNAGTNFTALVSAQMLLVGIWLPADTVITSVTFVSGTQAMVTGTNQWFGLYNSARGKLAVTSDDTSTAWGASTAKTLNLAAPFTTTYEGLHYLACMVKASTVPSLVGVTATPATKDIAPILSGLSTAALTNPASAPATAAAITTGQTAVEYAYVS